MTVSRYPQSTIRLASLGVILAGAMWGLFWIPVRALEDFGFAGAWPSLIFYLSALVIFLPLLIVSKQPKPQFRELAVVGSLTGTAFACYGTAIILTDVVRALLFFYITPVWGTALGVLFLGERLTAARVIAILLALTGLLAVVGFGSRSAVNLGDVLALASGLCWAVGSYKIYKLEDASPLHLSVSFVCGGIVMTGLLILFGGAAFGSTESIPSLNGIWPYFILIGLYALPMVFLSIWPLKIITPGRVGILFMSEVVIGFISVAILSGDPFGPIEALGAVLIVTATLIEVLGNKNAA